MSLLGEIMGASIDATNSAINYAQTERDFQYQQMLNSQAQANWQQEFDYTKQMNEQAQANWQAQMDFQKLQAGQQQANFEKQFEANRIGNLTKEYAKAGLNPFLAAGMGASTASASPVGGGGSANFNAPHGGANTKLIPNRSNEIKMQNMALMGQITMAEELNEAQINKLNAEANLSNTQAEDMTSTRQLRISKLENESKLTASQINEVIERTNKLLAEQKLVKAQEILTNEKSTTQELENAKKEIENEILNAVKNTEKAKAEAELNKIKTETKIMTSSEVRRWIDSIWAKVIPFLM